MEFFRNTKIDFLSKRKTFFFVSFVMVVGGMIAALLAGIDYGIDFTGGTEIAVKYKEGSADTESIRKTLQDAGISRFELKSYGAPNEFLIRAQDDVATAGTAAVSDNVLKSLRAAYPGADKSDVELLKVDTIGPKVGKELATNAVIAIILSIIAILIYVAFRFEFVYGLGAVVALLHDVVVAFAITVLFNKAGLINLEVNQALIAAFLTVLGFSINNTVIIFDRIRENLENYKNMSFVPLVNKSINDTLARTVNTFLTTALALMTIVLFGGEVLQGFAFTMLIGFIAGTYSSIYISSSFVVWFMENVRKVDVYGKLDRPKGAKVKVASSSV